MDEIVDAAMQNHLEALIVRLRAAGDGHDEPTDRFWAVVEDYLAAFEEQPGQALLWFDYWVQATRAGRVESVERIGDALVDLLRELLADAGVPDAGARARILFSYVIGALVRRELHPLTIDDLRPELATLSRMDVA